LAQAQVTSPAQQTKVTKQVTGQKLQEQAKSEPVETDYTTLYWLGMIFLFGLTLPIIRPEKKGLLRREQITTVKIPFVKAA